MTIEGGIIAILAPLGRSIMADTSLTVTNSERAFLVGLLEQTLQDKRVEEHRTRAPEYREHVLKQEEQITSLLKKLGKHAG